MAKPTIGVWHSTRRNRYAACRYQSLRSIAHPRTRCTGYGGQIPPTQPNNALYGTVGVCIPISSTSSEYESVSPAYVADVAFALKQFPLREQDFPSYADFLETAVVEAIRQPQHGELRRSSNNVPDPNGPEWKYRANSGYVGLNAARRRLTLSSSAKILRRFSVITVKITATFDINTAITHDYVLSIMIMGMRSD